MVRKLKLDIELTASIRIYSKAEWRLEGNKLVEIILIDNPFIGLSLALNPGDNIKLNGKEHHIVSRSLRIDERRYYNYIYEIQKGRYIPPKWVEAGEVSVIEP